MSDIVTASHVFLDNPATSVDEVLKFFSDKAIELGVANDAAVVLDAYKAREAEGTTGMMGGFAIPHCKSDIISEATILVAKFSGSVEWASMDGEPIKCAISLLIPTVESGSTHLTLLSKIAVMLMDEGFRASVLATDDADKIAALINEGLAE